MGTRLPLPSETHVRVGGGEDPIRRGLHPGGVGQLAYLDPFQLEMVKCMDMHLYSHILACIDRTAMHGQSMMNTIMAKDEIVGSGHKLMSFIMGKSIKQHVLREHDIK